jgi:PemK-like, MazF-like toxin of type II toxin-antitoxin system
VRLWWPEPLAGDIVWCHFPELPQLEPGPKPRPALILQVRETEERQFRVLVAYGTSRKLDALRTGEFAVRRQDGTAFRLAGLEADTKFSLQAAVELDYSDEWFKPPPLRPHGAQPKLGELHASLVQRAAAAWAALKA